MITFDYAQMNKKGLKDVVKWLEKQALPVKEVRGSNAPKRENGFQVKSAEIEFESGQILLVKAKANVPAFFQVKLNNKVLAIRDYKQLDNELREIAAFVKENEPKYAKNQEKAAAKAKIKIDVPKPVVTTTAEQTEAFKASLAELQGQSEALGNQITEVTAQVNQKAGQLADLQSKLDAEKATTSDLEAAIEKAQQGVFESATRLKKGDIVRFRKVVDPGDDKIRMKILEPPDGGRVLVEDLLDMAINPTHRYLASDLVLESSDPTEAQICENAALFPALKTTEKPKKGDIAKTPCPHCHRSNVLIYQGDKTFKCKSCGLTSRSAIMEGADNCNDVEDTKEVE